jgi:enediyne polyketide synthase
MTGPAPGGIAIVGMACRYPDAASPQQLWEMVLARRQAFRRMPRERLRLEDYAPASPDDPDSLYPIQAALLEGYRFDRGRFRIPADTFAAADLSHWLALDVAADALSDAGYAEGRDLPRATTGVIVANTLTGEFSRAASLRLRWPYVGRVLARVLEEAGLAPAARRDLLRSVAAAFKAPFAPPNEETLAGGLANVIAGRICNYFDLGGGGYTVDGACASSLLAVTTACDRLLLGDIDVALAGAVDLSLDPFELVGFARNGALARDDMRPYDARAAGFWPGEGAGFVVLMREADARRRRRPIQAVIRGYGISSDGEGGLTRPDREGQMLALSRAYERAGFGTDTVAYFEGHGTGTAVGDPVEIAAIAELRRQHGARGPAALGTIKANIGHTKAAAGMAGLLKAVMAVRRGLIPPATAVATPNPCFAACDGLIAPARASLWPSGQPRRAGISAMGFGGINAHVVLEVADSPDADAASRAAFSDDDRRLLASWQDAELFLFAAATPDDLSAAIGGLRALAADLSRAELGDAAAACAARLRPGRLRAAIVAGSASELAERLARLHGWVEAGIRDRIDSAGGVFVGAGEMTPRIGLLFPGQAAPSRLGGGLWRQRFAAAAALYDGSDLPESGEGSDTRIAQPAIVTASLAGLAVLARLGLGGDAALGHSLGELTALHWAGACDRERLRRLVSGRAEAMGRHAVPGGRMASIAASPEKTAALIAGLQAWVACHNGPAECVLAGDARAIEQALARAAARGIAATPLRVSHAFHTPHMAPAVPAFAAVLAAEPLMPPHRPVFSTITGAALPAACDPASLLREQLVAPVRFAPALAGLAETSDLLIEVGPGHGLTRLAKAATDRPAVALDAGGDSLRGLLAAAAAAFALGAKLRPERLFDDRFVRPFDLDRPLSFLPNPCEQAPSAPTDMVAAAVRPEPDASVAMMADSRREEAPMAPGATPLDIFRRLVAARVGLPLDSIEPSARLLGDLHLNSINVAELVTRFAAEIGVPPPPAPTQYANATVAEAVAALAALDGSPTDRTAADAHPAGVDAWTWPFISELTAREPSATADPATGAVTWQIRAPSDYRWRDTVAEHFAAVPDAREAGLVLCLPPDPGESCLPLLLDAARALARDRAISRFVLLQHGGGAAFARSLFHEHDRLRVCVVDLPAATPTAIAWAAAEAGRAGPGYTEAHYDAAGVRRVPVLRPVIARAAAGELPLGAGDVLVVTGGGKGIGAECALALARKTGARLALIGRSPPDDAGVAANLARIATAGVTVCYEPADITDAAAVRAAIARIEERFGRVSALIHAAGRNEPGLAADLEVAAARATLAVKIDGARNLLATIDAAGLRLFIAFGSIIAPLGLRGEAHYAFANEALARLVDDFAAAHPACRSLTVHWSVWAGTGMGERLGSLEALARQGVAALTIEQGVAALEDLLRRPIPARSVVLTGRFGAPPTVDLEATELPLLRFLERPRVYYPGVELIAEADIAFATDPYLRDHAIDGTAVVPAVLALEAIAQAVCALSGDDRPPTVEEARFLRAIVVGDGARPTIRIAALRRDADRIDVVIRSSADGFHSDHVRASACLGPRPVEPQEVATPEFAAAALPLVPDRDLYGTLLFHRGRFRRVAGYTRIAAAGCAAEIAAGATAAWFSPFLPADLCLGDPGARDAALHALQVCVPDRRVIPVAVERVVPGRLDATAAYRILARERAATGDRYTFDVVVQDDGGVAVETWSGLTLQAIEPLEPPAGWPLPLLRPYFERRLRAGFADREPHAGVEIAGRTTAPAGAAAHRPDGKPETPDGGVSFAYGDGLRLILTAASPAGCDLEAVVVRGEEEWSRLLGGQIGLARRLAAEASEDFDAAATRLWSVREALGKAGAHRDAPVVFERVAGQGWLELRAGHFRVLSAILRIAGQSRPLAIAFAIEADDRAPPLSGSGAGRHAPPADPGALAANRMAEAWQQG